ncbi:hypothetical protein HPP92_008433 [Vanilla planifolia]|uniref:Uncharacterized protein n=1 Tax=Vanilla planifolia TaxID=51239 RepID=A0A835V6D4_VANPL|nr:hypothetical protein HPP92_008433 [Vanilla planifolia]
MKEHAWPGNMRRACCLDLHCFLCKWQADTINEDFGLFGYFYHRTGMEMINTCIYKRPGFLALVYCCCEFGLAAFLSTSFKDRSMWSLAVLCLSYPSCSCSIIVYLHVVIHLLLGINIQALAQLSGMRSSDRYPHCLKWYGLWTLQEKKLKSD